MNVDLCSTMYNGVAKALLGSPYFDQCSYHKKLSAGYVDLYRVRTMDCPNPICRSYFPTFETYANTDIYAGCTLTDESTSRQISFKEFAVVCQGIASSSSSPSPAPTGGLLPPPLPPTPPLPSIQARDNESNNSITIIVAVTAIVVVGILVGAFVYMRTKRKAQDPPHSTDFVHIVDPAVHQDPPTSKVVRSTQPNTNHSTAPTATTTAGTTATRLDSSVTHSTNASSFQSVGGQLDMCDLDMYRLPTADVRLVKALAQGAFGEVWVGEYHGGKIAVKRLLPNKSALPDVQKFIWEIKLLSKIDCQFVVQFIGVAWNVPGDMMLLTEFMDGGDLRSVLDANKSSRSFTWIQKLKVALQVAEGLVYLHLMDPKVIHRDLKSRNVLLDSTKGAKITDFGIARETDDSTMTAGIGTFRWIAPEVLQDGHYTEAADMFSFGVILAELSTEIIPYSDLRNDKGNVYTDTAIMAKVMAGELRPSFATDAPMWYLTLANECLAVDPDIRPTAMQVAYGIRSQLEGFV
ncbi:TKL protein kinase [Aphanomyces invadans]|uniref:TKL protein kinase n=1 Tax=Aphanomyces invadans TaxID=157072 RepID=A0A024U0F4_9STRA|nr:TKL protein kinase [Aphanomyces invadans]ETV99743.1 TKL protein kinase [Aphanomyces invadans]|eukprot:XP_008871519.1 TKL protein kinase [Aphanomyces invadans]